MNRSCDCCRCLIITKLSVCVIAPCVYITISCCNNWEVFTGWQCVNILYISVICVACIIFTLQYSVRCLHIFVCVINAICTLTKLTLIIASPWPNTTVCSYGKWMFCTGTDKDNICQEATAVITSYLHREVSAISWIDTKLSISICTPWIQITLVRYCKSMISTCYDIRNWLILFCKHFT